VEQQGIAAHHFNSSSCQNGSHSTDWHDTTTMPNGLMTKSAAPHTEQPTLHLGVHSNKLCSLPDLLITNQPGDNCSTFHLKAVGDGQISDSDYRQE
jgi:hypothetical protein